MTSEDGSSETAHGSCVAIGERAVLFIGASGSGKSANALDLIAKGARLVADDQVVLTKKANGILATCITGFEGQIEARGLGVLEVDHTSSANVVLIVDLDEMELHRLPPHRMKEILGEEIPLINGKDNWHLNAAIAALLRGARIH